MRQLSAHGKERFDGLRWVLSYQLDYCQIANKLHVADTIGRMHTSLKQAGGSGICAIAKTRQKPGVLELSEGMGCNAMLLRVSILGIGRIRLGYGAITGPQQSMAAWLTT